MAQAELFQRQERGLRVLSSIAADREQRLDLQLRRALGQARDHLGADAAFVTRLLPAAPGIVAAEGSLDAVDAILALPADHTPCVHVFATGETISVPDAAADAMGDAAYVAEAGTRSYVGARVTVSGQPYGTVSFWGRQPRDPRHDDGDREFLGLLAGWVGATLERDAAMVAQRESEEAIRTLYVTASNSRMSLEDKIGYLLRHACVRAGLDGGVLALGGPGGMTVRVSTGDTEALRQGAPLAGDGAVADLLLYADHLVAIEDVRGSAYGGAAIATLHGVGALMGTSIRIAGRAAGILVLGGRDARPAFRLADKEYLQLLAQWIGGELEREQTVRALGEANQDLEALLASAQRLAHEADAANKAKSEFLAVMSHELRTPMNGVLGILDLLETAGLDRERQAQVELARESGRSLVSIVDDILDFSRVEAGELELRAEPFRLRELVSDVVELVTGVSRSRGVVVEVRIDPGAPDHLSGAELRVRQVLANLVGNAAKFTERGAITIDVRRDPGSAGVVDGGAAPDVAWLRFSVTDTGPGVPGSMRERLFVPFSQGDASSTRRHGGTGLGLAVSRGLVERMGGSIGFEPGPDGAGARFWFCLPLEIAAPADGRSDGLPGAADAASPVGRHLRILVAEDHPVNQAVTLGMLRRLGHAADLVENGQEALERLADAAYDLVLMDCRMPVLDGYDATAELRRRETAAGRARVPVVALTANAVAEERQRCLDAGMDDHLAKPITVASLADAIGRWARRPVAAPAPFLADGHPVGGDPNAEPATATPTEEVGGASPEPSDEHPVFDAARLEDLSGGDAAFAAELVGMLGLESRRLLGRIVRAVEDDDRDEVRSAAHALKGSSATLGFMALSEAARRLEVAARAGEPMGGEAADVERRLDDLALAPSSGIRGAAAV